MSGVEKSTEDYLERLKTILKHIARLPREVASPLELSQQASMGMHPACLGARKVNEESR